MKCCCSNRLGVDSQYLATLIVSFLMACICSNLNSICKNVISQMLNLLIINVFTHENLCESKVMGNETSYLKVLNCIR